MKPMTKFFKKHAASFILLAAFALLFTLIYFYNGSGAVSNEIESARLALQADGYSDIRYIDKSSRTTCGGNWSGYEFEARKNDVRARVVACPLQQGYFRLVVKVR